eukprot:COSAG01_NODE_355_length_18359_cov_3.808773_6_plen_90_part_00
MVRRVRRSRPDLEAAAELADAPRPRPELKRTRAEVVIVERGLGQLTAERASRCGHHLSGLQSKRLVIGSRWVSTPVAFAGTLRPRRLNN